MSENRAVDGSLIFDTKINKDGFEKDLVSIEKAAEKKDLEVTVDAVVDKAELEKDIKKIEHTVEKKDLEVTVDTSVDDKGFKSDIAKLDDTAKKALNQLNSPIENGELTFDTRVDGSGFAKAGEVMKGVLGANLLEKGMEKLMDFGKKGIELASDLEEVQNVVDVTFGGGADKIEAFAQSASSSFGLTELQAKQFSGTIGAMVKSMGLTEKEALDMSTALVGLTGDMASFYNLDHETAFEKIRSGISGETEPLKQLGINMSVTNLEAYALSKGIRTAYKDMSEAEKVNLRYGYIMQQTADAQGDFVRTQDGYANQVRILQNNLDTMAANIGSTLIPMFTSAASWMNSLFAGPVTNETQAAIDGAIKSLESLDDDVQDIKNNYTRDAIKIQIDYQKAEGLADDLTLLKEFLESKDFGDRTLHLGMTGKDVAALQNQLSSLGLAIQITDQVGVFGESTEAALKEYQGAMGLVADGIAGAKTYASLNAEDTQKLVDVTQQLVGIYPELAKYVGKDGVLNLEREKIQELITGYKDLALYKLMASKVEAIGGEYLDAAVNMKLLEENMKIAQGELDALTEQSNAMKSAFAGVNELFQNLSPGEALDPEQAVAAADAYIKAFGGLSDEIMKELDFSDADIDSIFSGGMLKTADEIMAVEGGFENLVALMNALRFSGSDEQFALDDEIQSAQQSVDTAKQAIEEFTPVLEGALKEYETAMSALDTYAEEIGKDIGEALGKDAAKSLEAQSDEVDRSTKAVIAIAQRTANSRPIKLKFETSAYGVSTSSAYPGHATGLDRVPYDNYLARLHVGESVLTASEAQRWRESKSGGGVTPAQLAAAMEPVVEAVRNIRIAMDIDGRQFASNQAANVRNAQNRYNTQIAKGYGK